MGRRKGRQVNGWLSLDKPEGITSAQAVGAVRRIFNAARAGHGGTLDPLATGLLPIAFGAATKTTAWVMDAPKTYTCTVRFGESRTTDDREGEVLETTAARPSRDDLEAALVDFHGRILQKPPIFSALKVEGKRAYALARAGETPDLPLREVTVLDVALLEMPDPERARFRIRCKKGFYVRSFARDIASRTGSRGYIETLRRTQCGPFYEKNAIGLDQLNSLGHSAPDDFLLPISTALDDIPALAVTQEESRRLSLGGGVPLSADRAGPLEGHEPVLAKRGETAVALTRLEDGILRPVRVLETL